MRSALPLLLVALLALPACSESPTDPDTTLRLTGSVTRGVRVDHPLPLDHGGNVTFTLEDLRIVLLDTSVTPPSAIALILGLGRREEAGGACDINTTAVLREGSVSSFGLRAGEYCVVIFDNGFLPEESRLEYTLLAEFTD
jgi:hypothetical protein